MFPFLYLETLGWKMPVVQIDIWEGRTDEQKAQLIDAISDAFAVIDVQKHHVIVVIHETPRSNWGL
jgi:4-oxalocrotonate tautomerase